MSLISNVTTTSVIFFLMLPSTDIFIVFVKARLGLQEKAQFVVYLLLPTRKKLCYLLNDMQR
jgi:hypothetical protein